MKGQKLPPEDHIIRYVPFGKLRKDEDDNVLGLLAEAFRRRPGEKYLSSTWLEYFEGNREQQLCLAVQTIRSSLSVGKKSGFAIGNVQKLSLVCAERNHKIRIVHEPEDDNAAHVAVRRIPSDDEGLLELLAAEMWAELVLNTDVPERRSIDR
jgi:hypothetical protein